MLDGSLHSIVPFMLQDYTSTPRSLTPVALDLMLRLWMDSSSVSRGWWSLRMTIQRFPKSWRSIGGSQEHLGFKWQKMRSMP